MNRRSRVRKNLFLFLFVVTAAAPVFAAAYTLKVPLPTSGGGQVTEINGPAQYIETIYTFGIGAGTLLAIAMVVIGGIRWAVSEAIPSKEEALEQIKQALLGLALLLAAGLILKLLNPKLDIQNLQPLQPTVSMSAGSPDHA